MKKHMRTLSVVLVVLVLALALGSWVVAQGSDNQPDSPVGAASLDTSDTDPGAEPEVVIPEKYQPTAGALAAPPRIPTTPVYFTPQDLNNSCTVIFLYNTSTSAASVRIQSWQTTGSEYVDTTVVVPANGMVRICADSTTASWADVILVNFRVYSAYARMLLPAGVKAEAYVAWQGNVDYNPDLTSVPVLPIRFSTDPASVFLPAVHSD